MKPIVYLDYNATTPVRPQVLDVMAELHTMPYNASSVHTYGRQAKKVLEDSRKVIADTLSCFSEEIIFTASGTEANHQCLQGVSSHSILVSTVEHASIMKQRVTATIPVDSDGLVQIDSLETLLREHDQPALVSIILANNETGVVQSIKDIADVVHKYGGLLHTDAAQAYGKIPLDIGLLGIDLMTLSAHKMGGPIGAAALFVRQGLDIASLFHGGGQEMGRRAGTENIVAIAGFAKAAELAQSDDWQGRIRNALDKMEEAFISAVPDAIILGKGQKRLPGTSAVLIPGVSSETQLMSFDLEGFAISAGSACSSGRIAPSHVVHAMGYSDEMANSVIRVSVGWDTKLEEIEFFKESWLKLARKIAK